LKRACSHKEGNHLGPILLGSFQSFVIKLSGNVIPILQPWAAFGTENIFLTKVTKDFDESFIGIFDW
jgi:hypothetical protein